MKNKKVISFAFVYILILSFLFQDINITQEDREDGTKKDILSTLSTSNSIEHQWNVTWGGIYDETAEAMAIDSLGNIFLAGYTNNTISGDYDMCLVKFDSLGVYQWNVTRGESGEDFARAIALDSSDNIYLAGTLDEHGLNPDMCLVKFNNLGEYQWNSTWDGGDEDEAIGIALDLSEDIYLAGYTYDNIGFDEDMCLVKFDNNGQYQWNSTWGGNEDDEASAIALDSSDNIYLAGDYTIVDDVDSDFCLVKFNSLGVYQWNSTWGGSGMDMAFDLALDSSENFYLVGGYETSLGDLDIGLVSFTDSGLYQWNRTWGGSNSEAATTIVLDSSDNIYIGGAIDNTGMGNYDFYFAVCDNLGFQQWNHTWGGSGLDIYWGIILDSLESVILGGTWDMDQDTDGANPDMCLVKFEILKINSPSQNEFFGSISPNFEISILRPKITKKWYTLDGRITNITFSGLTGTINQTEWDEKGNGPVTIGFYANDTLGYVVFAEVTVQKDTLAPSSSISFIRHEGTNIVNKSTTFTLTADDGLGSGVSVIRYRINNSDWIDYTNPFDLSSYEYGDYLISYQAIDLVDNIETVNTLLVRLVEIPSEPSPPDIPGYSILLFIGIISVISIFLIKKQKNSINNF